MLLTSPCQTHLTNENQMKKKLFVIPGVLLLGLVVTLLFVPELVRWQDQRTRLNDVWLRDTGSTIPFWTEDRLEGKRYGGKKPVFILVDRDTKSAGEDFAYTMQALKRATVIGSRTWGGAHPTRLYRLGDHFFAAVPDARSINPITHTNWEGVGVIPDVEAAPSDALKVASELLQRPHTRKPA
jgi:C-terminal processing protease CtpA/Prc